METCRSNFDINFILPTCGLVGTIMNIKSHNHMTIDNPMCPCEEEEQTVDHLIFKCKKLSNQRNERI